MPKDAAFPALVKVGLVRLAYDRAEELGSAAHVARRGHGATITNAHHIDGRLTASVRGRLTM